MIEENVSLVTFVVADFDAKKALKSTVSFVFFLKKNENQRTYCVSRTKTSATNIWPVHDPSAANEPKRKTASSTLGRLVTKGSWSEVSLPKLLDIRELELNGSNK